jgi:hypothetical protein
MNNTKAIVRFWALIVLSLLLLISFTIFTIKDFHTVGNSYFFLCCYSLPFIFSIILIFLSIPLLSQISSIIRFLPIAVNIATLIIGFGLFKYYDHNPDKGFHYLFKDYSEAARQIENGKLQGDNDGFVQLPDNLKDVSITGDAYIIRKENLTVIYFMYDRETFDGFSWGYLYRSDGSDPPKMNDARPLDCYKARQIIPPTPKWFYCEWHRVYWSPND